MIDLIGNRTRDFPACSIVPPLIGGYYLNVIWRNRNEGRGSGYGSVAEFFWARNKLWGCKQDGGIY
jgi:hypothetical protein